MGKINPTSEKIHSTFVRERGKRETYSRTGQNYPSQNFSIVTQLVLQPSGEPATIKWLTVGGRTSAYVTELQRLSSQDGSLHIKKQKKRRKTNAQVRIRVIIDPANFHYSETSRSMMTRMAAISRLSKARRKGTRM